MKRRSKNALIEKYAGYGKGWSGGYSTHRYGVKVDGEYVDAKSRITLARQHQKVLNEAKRDNLVEKSVDLLREVQFSLWQHEAGVRYSLRLVLIKKGYRWQISDDVSADIVRRAFNILGRGKETRPSADDASEERFIPIENCLVCYRPLDEADMAKRFRYCCPDHARFAHERRVYAEGWYNSEFGKAAYRQLYRERFEERVCENPKCRHPNFRPAYDDQRFCCVACKYESQKMEYEPRECALEGCTAIFTPNYADQKFCSQAHATASFATVQVQQCARDGCDHWFKPSHNNAKEGGQRGLYCSRECADADRGNRVYNLICQCCGDPFTASMPNALTCCNSHYQILRKFEQGRPPKRMSPAVFDYLFCRDRNTDEEHAIHRLFDDAA